MRSWDHRNHPDTRFLIKAPGVTPLETGGKPSTWLPPGGLVENYPIYEELRRRGREMLLKIMQNEFINAQKYPKKHRQNMIV